MKSEPAKILKEKYKELFEVAEEREKKNKEMNDFIFEKFGFDFKQMSVVDFMKLTESIIDYRLKYL